MVIIRQSPYIKTKLSEKFQNLFTWVKTTSDNNLFRSCKIFQLPSGNWRSCPEVRPGTRPWNSLRSSVSVLYHTSPSILSGCAQPSRARRIRCTLAAPHRVSYETCGWAVYDQYAIGRGQTPPCGWSNTLAGAHGGPVEFGRAYCPPPSSIRPAISPLHSSEPPLSGPKTWFSD